MGKKSKRSKPKAGQKGGGAAPAPAAAAAGVASSGAPPPQPPAPQPPTPPPDASCWICLDGDPDEGGKPIVRDCSCRGDDAGFVHLSCVIKYAEGKTRELMSAPLTDQKKYNEPWTTCPNCRRDYQRRFAIEMANARLSYLDENYHQSSGRIVKAKLDALSVTLRTLVCQMPYKENPDLRDEGRLAADNIISIVQSGADENNANVMEETMFAYACLGKFAEAEKTSAGYGTALDCYAKVRDLNEGNEEIVNDMEFLMEKVKSRRDGGKEEITEQQLQRMRIAYEECVRKGGGDGPVTLANGINLLHALGNSGRHYLEYERAASKLYKISRRANGPDHQLTQQAETAVQRSRIRRIAKVSRNTAVAYEVLRISNDERKYVLKKTSAPDEGQITEVAFDDDDFVMATGTPVVCRGLKSAAHLNGKLGDTRSFNMDTGRYAVRFEDRSLGTVSVRPVNLRIAFDLPEEP